MVKKALNILSVIDLSLLALWALVLLLSRIFAENTYFSAAFVIIYAIAIIAVLIHTIASVILLLKKKKFSLPLLIFTYVMNIAWISILAMVINHATNIF